jgi:hypothetical protein
VERRGQRGEGEGRRTTTSTRRTQSWKRSRQTVRACELHPLAKDAKGCGSGSRDGHLALHLFPTPRAPVTKPDSRCLPTPLGGLGPQSLGPVLSLWYCVGERHSTGHHIIITDHAMSSHVG